MSDPELLNVEREADAAPLMLRPDQIEDLALAMVNERFMFLGDPATGKTPPACVWLYWLWHEFKERSVWQMPKSIMAKNRLELLRFSDFKEEDVVIVDGTAKQRLKLMQSDAKVFIMGFTTFYKEWSLLKKIHPDLNGDCVDEFHLGYSTHKSKRTQELYLAHRVLKRFLPMTGTLVKGRLNSIYPAIHIVEPRYYGSHEQFMAEHAELDFFGNILGWKSHEKVSAILTKHSARRTFESVHGPEAKVIIPILCEMSPKQRAAYDEFHDKAILELEDQFLDGTLPGVATIRARQIMECPEIWGIADGELTGKDAMSEIHFGDAVNDKKPFAVFSAFIPQQLRLFNMAEKMGLRVGLINGDVSPKERGRIDQAFIAGDLQGVVGSPATATVGFNWGHCDRVDCVSIDYNDDTFLQAYRRFIRGRRSTPLLIRVFQYLKSLDQRVFRIVEQKMRLANKVDQSREVINLSGNNNDAGLSFGLPGVDAAVA